MSDITRGGVREPTRAEEILALGLRDEKRRQIRRRIAETATGLFLEHGFAQVTIAEVARTAEVSVNTVYTYFPSKEDLVCYPEEASAERMVQMVRDRAPGTSAANAVLAALRADLRRDGRDGRPVGIGAAFGRFLDMVRAEPSLAARLDAINREMVDALAATLAAETGAGPDDPLPLLVAAQLGWAQEQLFRHLADHARAEPVPSALKLLDAIEDVLGDRVLSYARR